MLESEFFDVDFVRHFIAVGTLIVFDDWKRFYRGCNWKKGERYQILSKILRNALHKIYVES